MKKEWTFDDFFEGGPTKIPVDCCIISVGVGEMTEDDPLVISIRDMGGSIHPIIAERLENEKYGVVVGNRRVLAYRILKKEDSRYEEILAHVSKGLLTEEQKKVLSFAVGYGRKDISHKDYVDVIEYFYDKYGGGSQGIIHAADEMGISVKLAKNYLREARLPDKVKECIRNREFTLATALMALKVLGDDEESVDEDVLITTAKELQKLPPSRRKDAGKRKKGGPHRLIHTLKIELTDSQMKKLSEYTKRMQYENVEDMIMEIVDRGLAELEDD